MFDARNLLDVVILTAYDRAFATLNRGVNTESACPSCETPTGLFATSTAPGKLRTVAEYYALWKKMQQCSAEERDKVFRALGIVDIKVETHSGNPPSRADTEPSRVRSTTSLAQISSELCYLNRFMRMKSVFGGDCGINLSSRGLKRSRAQYERALKSGKDMPS